MKHYTCLLVFAAGFVCWRSLQSPDRALHRHAVTRREVAAGFIGGEGI